MAQANGVVAIMAAVPMPLAIKVLKFLLDKFFIDYVFSQCIIKLKIMLVWTGFSYVFTILLTKKEISKYLLLALD